MYHFICKLFSWTYKGNKHKCLLPLYVQENNLHIKWYIYDISANMKSSDQSISHGAMRYLATKLST